MKPVSRFPSLVLPSSGSEGLLSAFRSDESERNAPLTERILSLLKKNYFNIHALRELVKHTELILRELLACHSFFVYFHQHEQTRSVVPSQADCSFYESFSREPPVSLSRCSGSPRYLLQRPGRRFSQPAGSKRIWKINASSPSRSDPSSSGGIHHAGWTCSFHV